MSQRLAKTHGAAGLAPVAEPGAQSTQVYRWPAIVPRLSTLLPATGIALFAFGAFFGIDGFETSDLAEVAFGLVMTLTAISLFLCCTMLHVSLAREIRFTRESLVVRQSWRRDLELSYAAYQFDWVADTSTPGLVRLIFFGRNRGCMVLSPPDWLITSLHEIARIQLEEGWYLADCDRLRLGDD